MIEIKNCEGPRVLSTVSNIYIIASSKKKNLCLCSFHMKAIWVSDLIEIYKLQGAKGPEHGTKTNWDKTIEMDRI